MANGYARYNGLSGGSGAGGGVSSLNGETGALTLLAGTGISIIPSGSNITIANTETPGTGTVTSVSVVTANGLTGSVATPTTTPAITLSTTITGLLQGNGTAISAYTGGNLTDIGTDGIVITGGTGSVIGSGTSIAQAAASASQNGYLKSTDWTTFNNKGSGSVTSVGLSAPSFLSVGGSPVTASGTLALSYSGTALPIANGGTGVTSVTTAPVATAFAGWDSNENLTFNSGIPLYTTQAPAAAATTTLTVASTQYQNFTGTSGGSFVKLPVVTTLVNGQSFILNVSGSSSITVQSSNGTAITIVGSGETGVFTCINTAGGAGVASWSFYIGFTTINLAYQSTVTSGSGVVITTSSAYNQFWTGSTAQFVELPAPTAVGLQFYFANLSTATITVDSTTPSAITTIPPSTTMLFTAVGTGASASAWAYIPGTINSQAQNVVVGGTGTTTAPTANGVIYGSSTTAYGSTAAGTTNQVLTATTSSAPTWAAPATGSYSQAYFGQASSWTIGSSTGVFIDPTNSGGNTLTVRKSAGITLTAAASNLCGVTFTPPNNTAVYMIWAQVGMVPGGDNIGAVRMTDGTTVIASPASIVQGTNTFSGDYVTLTVGGIYAPASASAVTVKLQLSGVSISIENTDTLSGNASVEWTVLRIF